MRDGWKVMWKVRNAVKQNLRTDRRDARIFLNANGKGVWKYSVDNEFCKDACSTREEAVEKVFCVLEKMKY